MPSMRKAGGGVTDLTPAVRERLVAISNRDLDERSLTPGEAADIIAALDAERARNRNLEAVAEAALRAAVEAFAQYALDTNTPDAEAIDGFMEGFKQEGERHAALAVLEEPPA